MNPPSVTETPASTLTLTRVFDAPRAVVFKAWTEAERLAQWWGPNSTSSTRTWARP